MEEKSVHVSHEDYDAETKLNSKQKVAFTIIMERINSRRSCAFFIDGLGGISKIFLYRALLAQVRSKRLIALVTTTSGVAAVILLRG